MSKIVKSENVEYQEAGELVIGDIPALTIENMDTALQRAFKWYQRLGNPSRDDMKVQVKTMIDSNHPHINITVAEIDVLPWNEAGVVHLTWEEEDRARKARERAEADLQRQKELKDRADKQRDAAEAGRRKREELQERLRKKAEDRKRKDEENKKKKESDLADIMRKEEEERRKREEAEKARRLLEKYCKELKSSIKDKSPSDEKVKLDDAIDSTMKWLEANPKAGKEMCEEKHKVLEELAKKFAEADRKEVERNRREAEEAKKRLVKYCGDLESVMDSTKFKDFVPEEEKKKLKDAVGGTMNWVNANPMAEKEDYEEKHKALQDTARPILEKIDKLEHLHKEREEKMRAEEEAAAKRRKEEEERQRKAAEDAERLQKEEEERKRNAAEEAERLRQEKENKERRKREIEEKAADAKRRMDEEQRAKKEALLKEKQERRKTIEELEKEMAHRELTEEEKRMMTEFYATRRLIAYNWWSRMNRPGQKKMKRMINTLEDMRYADVKQKDVDLLPWLNDGFFVDVPKMSGWLATLDPKVVEQVNRWM